MAIRELETGRIELWTSFLHEITDPALLAKYKDLLTADELSQQVRFHFERDQHRYLVTRALARVVLSKYCKVRPEDWSFCKGSHGKPAIADEHAELAGGLSFNISHTQGLVMIGVTREASLGIDVENLQRQKPALGIAESFFAKPEVDALREIDEDSEQQRRFFEYWTLKESYIKAIGLGLSTPLDQFHFSFPSPRTVQLTLHQNTADSSPFWFAQFQPASDYIAAMCIQNGSPRDPILTNTRIIPLGDESSMPMPILRSTSGCG